MTLHGKTQRITHIYDQLRSNLGVPLGNLRVLVGDVRWMNNDTELLFDLEMLNAPNPNYDLYIYNLNARSLKRLTRGEKDEDYPDWTEGTLSVSPQDKKEATWGEVKKKKTNKLRHNLFTGRYPSGYLPFIFCPLFLSLSVHTFE